MRIFLLFLICFMGLEAQICYFIPPQGWEAAKLKNPSPHIQIGFLGSGKTEFRPSINLAVEEVDVPLKKYVKAVKELHSQDLQISVRDLGSFKTTGGKAHLLEMSNPSPFGELKILQAILVKNNRAYILTSAVLKEEFAKFQTDILKSLSSLDVVKEIWKPVKTNDLRERLKMLFSSIGKAENKDEEWQSFQKVITSIDEMGPYWKFLALKEGQQKIFPESNSKSEGI